MNNNICHKLVLLSDSPREEVYAVECFVLKFTHTHMRAHTCAYTHTHWLYVYLTDCKVLDVDLTLRAESGEVLVPGGIHSTVLG